MSRENSPYVAGAYWLDKRRDGKAAGVWQIATYKPDTRVPSRLIAPERDRPTLAELNRAPVGFFARVWGIAK